MHVNGICRDGGKDETQMMVKKEDKLNRNTMIEHYVVVGKPGELIFTCNSVLHLKTEKISL